MTTDESTVSRVVKLMNMLNTCLCNVTGLERTAREVVANA